MLSNQAEALLIFRPERIFQKEKVERLELFREPSGLNGRESLVYIVKQLDLVAQLIPQIGEQVRNDAEIIGRLPICFHGRHGPAIPNYTSVRRPPVCGGRFGRSSYTICPNRAGNRTLSADDLEAFVLAPADAFVNLCEL